MDSTVIKKLLGEWKTRKIPETTKRDMDISKTLWKKPKRIKVVTGLRRIGKTYLCFLTIKKLLKEYGPEEVIYLNLEDERIPKRTEILSSLIPTATEFFGNKIKCLFLDEIQNIPQWSKWLRRMYDTEDFEIVVTGSSSKLGRKEIPTELRGRFSEIRVFPLSFSEFLKFKDKNFSLSKIEYLEEEKSKLMRLFDEYLLYGGMPEVVISPVSKKTEILQDYYESILSRDIVERYNIESEEKLKSLMRLLFNSTIYTTTKLYHTLKSLNIEVGKTTVNNYLSYVEKSYFMDSLYVFSPSIKNSIQAPRKVYFGDTGFLTALSVKFSKNFGRLFENLVYIELKRKGHEDIFYWKDRYGKEVDFVIMKKNKVNTLIQACYDVSDKETLDREVSSLLSCKNSLKCKNLVILTKDYSNVEKIKGNKIKFIPFWKWHNNDLNRPIPLSFKQGSKET